ncbi:EAL domain-containing protein [Halioglobus maricola]|uniref:EAL domain-containing protein n=1 Tax=Halioglobus maricola TaxID=2601894 RepID=A0A5P9NKJ1_9GAMM|nr:EAL domain-containing protein [Halioglobus maricola]QFU76383.1 EAL domain-containing protein [Halioglobus maricola]
MSSEDQWFIEGYFNGLDVLGRVAVNQFPFQIGRKPGIHFTVPSRKTSRLHAVMENRGGQIFLTDTNSTNGTYINRKLVQGEQRLHHGDVLHFADFEVRLIRARGEAATDAPNSDMTVTSMPALPRNLAVGIRELQELLEHKMVEPAFQPIVECAQGNAIHAYEILGRGTHEQLSPFPGPLFHIAESISGLALELSKLFRSNGLEVAAQIDTDLTFFINIHPEEVRNIPLLLEQISASREQYPSMPMVLEIHEKAVSDIPQMKILRDELSRLDIGLAYDDFGAGQARLMELIEVPADYLKFDMNLIRDIDQAEPKRREMVRMFVDMAKRVGSRTIAEGVETAGESQACHDMGFDFIQGYYYGKPKQGKL